MKRKRTLLAYLLGSLLFHVAGCGPIYADGPYHGRVLDAETKQPIEGAAVLAVWWKRTPMVGHPIESVHDAQETITDKDGNFTIPGISAVSPISRIDKPRFTIFKPSYKAYSGYLVPLVGQLVPTGLYEKDGKMVAELQPLRTREERLRNLDNVRVPACLKEEYSRLCLPKEKFPNILRFKEIEYENLGLKAKPKT